MRYFYYYIVGRYFLGNPLLAFLAVFIIYAILDRNFIGILPDFLLPWKRKWRIGELKREIAINPYQGRAFYEIGALEVEKGNMKAGKSYLEKANELMPEHPDVLYYLGVCELKTGDLQAGKVAIEKALEINPKVKYGTPYLYLIEYYIKQGQYNEKVEEYMKKIASYGNPEIFYKLGMVYSRAGQKDKAKEMFQEAQINFKAYPSFYKKQYRSWAFRAKLRSIM